MKFYDTNAILKLQDKIFEEDFIISSVTLQELEHIKVSRNKDDHVKYEARKVLHLLDDNSDKYEVVVYDNLCNSSKESLKRVEELSGKYIKYNEGCYFCYR